MPVTLSPEQKREWEERVLQQKESGLSILSWCREHNVNYDSMLYWRRCFGFSSPRTITRSSFKELPVSPDTTGITIEYQRIKIHLSKDCDPATLTHCLRALKEQP
jgi:transposase-like protein